ARRHPDAGDTDAAGRRIPKYVNTATTILFHKNAQLYGLAEPHDANASIPVIVEGPLDAMAVTLATAGAYLGVAPLGTSLTSDQARELAAMDAAPTIATAAGIAGRVAAERDYWILTPHGPDPGYAQFSPGEDPAGLLADHGPTSLRAALFQAEPLAENLI